MVLSDIQCPIKFRLGSLKQDAERLLRMPLDNEKYTCILVHRRNILKLWHQRVVCPLRAARTCHVIFSEAIAEHCWAPYRPRKGLGLGLTKPYGTLNETLHLFCERFFWPHMERDVKMILALTLATIVASWEERGLTKSPKHFKWWQHFEYGLNWDFTSGKI